MINRLGYCAKAITGGIIPALAYLYPVVDDGLLWSEGLTALLAFVVGFNGVYWVENSDQ